MLLSAKHSKAKQSIPVDHNVVCLSVCGHVESWQYDKTTWSLADDWPYGIFNRMASTKSEFCSQTIEHEYKTNKSDILKKEVGIGM